MESVKQAFHTETWSISQRQTVIKLIEKKDRGKRNIKNWRLISSLYINIKILSKAVSNKLKTVLPTLISSQQTAYVKNRFIGESDRLISDIIEISSWFNITGFLVTMDIAKTLNSLGRSFLISILKRFSFGKKFITWIEILLKDQQSCDKWWNNYPIFSLRNRRLPRWPSFGTPFYTGVRNFTSFYKKKHPEIKGMEIAEYCFLYIGNTDETGFFEGWTSIENLVEIFNTFFFFRDWNQVWQNVI